MGETWVEGAHRKILALMNSVFAVRRDLNKTPVIREQVTSSAAGMAVTGGAPGGCSRSYLALGKEERDVHDGSKEHM